MSKVLILGAGASYGHGYGISPRDRPPLVNRFFCHPLFSEIRDDYKRLIIYLNDLLQVDIERNFELDLECLVGELEPLWGLHVLRQDAYGHKDYFAFAHPSEYLRSFITDCVFLSTTWLSRAECPHHNRLVRDWLSKGDTIISFNYDLIADTSLLRHSNWTEDTGYGWISKDKQSISKDSTFIPSSRLSRTNQPDITLLKPHGSLNFSRFWKSKLKQSIAHIKVANATHEPDIEYRRYDTIAVQRLSEFWNRFAPRIIPSLNRDYENEQNSMRKEFLAGITSQWRLDGRDSYTEGILPLMIIPTPYKSFEQMSFAELQTVWQHIVLSLKRAKQALSCGFSFRDAHFNAVLRKALQERDGALPLTIVDPSTEVLAEIIARLSTCQLKITPVAQTLEEYVISMC